jgi:hydrogenase nickel incorporation protein HypA/HybF
VHELSVAQSLLDLVAESVPTQRHLDVRVVRVKVGGLSGVIPESLEFCFDALTTDTPLSRARMEIERVPIRLSCASCQDSFETESPRFRCPGCGSSGVQMVAGSELDLTEVELDDGPAEVT